MLKRRVSNIKKVVLAIAGILLLTMLPTIRVVKTQPTIHYEVPITYNWKIVIGSTHYNISYYHGGRYWLLYPLNVYDSSDVYQDTFLCTRESTVHNWPNSGTPGDPYGADATCPPGCYRGKYWGPGKIMVYAYWYHNPDYPQDPLIDIFALKSAGGTERQLIEIHGLGTTMRGCMGIPPDLGHPISDLIDLLFGPNLENMYAVVRVEIAPADFTGNSTRYDHYTMRGTMDTAGHFRDLDESWRFGEWETGGGVPFATRQPYLTPLQICANIKHDDTISNVTGVGYLTVHAETYSGLDHIYWDPRLERWFRFQTFLEEDGYGWLFTGSGTNPILGDVDYYVFSNDTGVYWLSPSPKAGTPTALTCLPLLGPDGIPGTADDGFGDGTTDPAGSSILYLPTELRILFWCPINESWHFLSETPFPMIMTTGTAYNIVNQPDSQINGCNSTAEGKPWEFLAGLDHPEWKVDYDNPKWNAYVTYACVWSRLNITTTLGRLDIIYEVDEKLVREDCVVADINCNELVDIIDLTIAALGLWSEDEGVGPDGIPMTGDDKPVADPQYDFGAQADVANPRGLIDIVDLTAISLQLWKDITPQDC